MLKVINVVGARPNFMKVAPMVVAMKRREREFAPLLVHTGQHYDADMSDAFFRDLNLPEPDIHLGVGSAPREEQIAVIQQRFAPVVDREKPNWIIVVGDVNSTLACAIVGKQSGTKVAHIEAGLRSYDSSMPEEANRVETDRIADLLFTPSVEADANLRAEGISPDRIRLVGNIMIDSLYEHLDRSRQSPIRHQLDLTEKSYAVLTLHRPTNVDDPVVFSRVLAAVERLSEKLPVIFPVHPRTRKTIAALGLGERIAKMKGLRLIEPLGYLDFLSLYSGARLVLTDSGGIQEETTVLGIPCLTLRKNTERPLTVSLGTNRIVGTDTKTIVSEAFAALERAPKPPVAIPLWDGHTADRILNALT
jgi:UDP-N-acetylglucosamine 2-epimerase (non-hydrolysing)